MAGIPEVFRKQGEKAIASYDYADIASGLGFQTYYLYVTEDAAKQYSLQSVIIYSGVRETSQSGNGTTTLTFDTSTFNLPRTVEGTAYINIGVELSTGAGANSVTAKLQKWDGSTATDLTATSTKSFQAVADQTIYSFELKITTSTLIKKGEQLRVVITATNNSGAGTFITIGHDPKNLDGSRITPSTEDTITSSRIIIPFKIDL